ncbi:MAG: thioredoxin domain-containing protein [Myxococcota bacterium]
MTRLFCLILLFTVGCSKSCAPKESTAPLATSKPQVTEFNAVSLEGLNAQQQTQFIKLVNDEICPCNCPMSFAACIQDEDTCKPAVILAQWIIERLKEQVPMEMMAPALSQEINSGFSANPQIIDIADYSVKGAANAPFTLIEFADFECVHCKQTAQFIEQFIAKHPEVRFIYKHFPSSVHPQAKQASIAAEAAGEQGKFWEMHHALFGSIRPLTDHQIESLAKKWKLNMPRFKADMNKSSVQERVESSIKEAAQLGIAGTPALFFNGRPYHLSSDLLGLELRLAMEKARSQQTCQK